MMRDFNRIDEWKLLQIGLQTAILIVFPTIWTVFHNFR